MSPAAPLDIIVLTGFLGTGKTTVLRHVLAQPAMQDSAVLINEVGEIGLDHQLIEYVDEDVVLLSSGCLCCSFRADLAGALRRLLMGRMAERSRPFRRILIETSGLSDPGPILAALSANAFIRDRCRLRCVLTTVDAVFGEAQLLAHAEARRQVGCADTVLITKTDLVDSGGLPALRRLLHELNPTARIVEVRHGAIEPELAFAIAQRTEGISLGPSTQSRETVGPADGEHLHDVTTTALSWSGRSAWQTVAGCLDSLLREHGAQLLRLKGIVHLHEQAQPVALHGVQHVLYPPAPLSNGARADGMSHVVVIAAGVPSDRIAAHFTALASSVRPTSSWQAQNARAHA